jgi:3-hydroxyisobutyrate dehydrogenase-like beta-hydroxyacid dehydrogenase
MTRIGFIGAGQLGEPMVVRLLAAGHDVSVYARRADVLQRLCAAGACATDTTADLFAASDIVISCLFSDTQLNAIADGPGGLLAAARPGLIFVSHTTGAVSTLTRLADAAPRGMHVFDAPVSGTSADITRGRLTALLGGPAHGSEDVVAVLSAYCDPIIRTGELGSALNVKLVNNLLFAANAQLIGAAVDLAGQLGVDPTRLLTALRACSGGSVAAASVLRYGGLEPFVTGVAPFMAKDIDVCLTAAREANADIGLFREILDNGPLNLRIPAPTNHDDEGS